MGKFWRKLISDVFSSENYCSLVKAVSNHNNHSKFIRQIATYKINKIFTDCIVLFLNT